MQTQYIDSSRIGDLPEGTFGRYIHIAVENTSGDVKIEEVMCYEDPRLIPGEDFAITGITQSSNNAFELGLLYSVFVGRDGSLL